MSDVVTYESNDGIAVVTINRADKMNALNEDVIQGLKNAWVQLEASDDRVAILHAAGDKAFSVGADIKNPPAEMWEGVPSVGVATSKPIIAALHGWCIGGAYVIVQMCDLVIASERAWFEWAYLKTGLTGAESSTFFFPRLVGLRKALELVLLNPRLSAREALDWGLINRVVPDGSIDSEAMKVAAQLAESPTSAVGVAKGLLNQAAGMDRLDVHLDSELTELARIADGPNVAEGISAFFDKRPAEFESE